jgi:hypothetical protein
MGRWRWRWRGLPAAERVRLDDRAQRALGEDDVARGKRAQCKETAALGAGDASHGQRAAVAAGNSAVRTSSSDINGGLRGRRGASGHRAAKCANVSVPAARPGQSGLT